MLMMRFSLSPYQALPLAKKWLAKNRDKSWFDLEQMLEQRKITYNLGKLKELQVQDIVQILNLMTDEKAGIQLKNRWYNFRLYQKTFFGSQAVKWLMKNAKMDRQAAIQFGQMLIDRGIIKPINCQYSFEDENLCYCFYHNDIETPLNINQIKLLLNIGPIG